MTEINKSAGTEGHHEPFFAAVMLPPCQVCKANNRIIPHNPAYLLDCPHCGTPFPVATERREEIAVITRPPTTGERIRGNLGAWLSRNTSRFTR